MYTVELKPSAADFIERQTAKIRRQLIRRIEALAGVPRPENSTILHIEKQLRRVQSGNYRIIYQVQDDKLLVLVVKVGHRRDIYRRM